MCALKRRSLPEPNNTVAAIASRGRQAHSRHGRSIRVTFSSGRWLSRATPVSPSSCNAIGSSKFNHHCRCFGFRRRHAYRYVCPTHPVALPIREPWHRPAPSACRFPGRECPQAAAALRRQTPTRRLNVVSDSCFRGWGGFNPTRRSRPLEIKREPTA